MNRWLLLLMLGLLWAPSFIFIKVGLHDIPPLTLAAGRITLAGLILYAVLRIRGGTLPTSPAIWRRFAVMGFFATALPFALFSIGEQYADSGLAAIFNGTTPIATALIAHFTISEERLTPTKLLGVLIGFAGIVTIVLPGMVGPAPGSGSVWGLLAFAVAALSYGISLVYGRKYLRGLAPLVAPSAQLAVSSALLVPAALILDPPMTALPGLPAVGSVLFLAVFGTALAYVLYYRLLESASATFTSLVTYFLPPAGVLLSIVFLGERLGWSALAGCIIIVIGLLVMNDVPGKAGRRFRRTNVLPAE